MQRKRQQHRREHTANRSKGERKKKKTETARLARHALGNVIPQLTLSAALVFFLTHIHTLNQSAFSTIPAPRQPTSSTCSGSLSRKLALRLNVDGFQ